jgi:hypothetical protein
MVVLALVLAVTASSATGQSQATSQAEFRRQLTTYLAQMEQVATMLRASPQGRAAFARLGIDAPRALAQARHVLPRLTPSQLALLQQAYAATPGWQQQPRLLREILLRHGFSPRGTFTTQGVDENCDPGPGTPLGITDVFIAKGVALAANLVMEGFPTDGLTILARLIPIAAWGVAEAAVLVLEGLNAVEAECNGAKLEHFTRTQLDVQVSTRASQVSLDSLTVNFNSLSTLIGSRLDVAVSTRATQASLDAFHSEFTANATVVNTKLDAVSSSLVSAHQKLDNLATLVMSGQQLQLRLEIEADLSEPGNHPVALFELPASAGGHLDFTREIVVDTIAKMQAAGQSVGNANAHLAAGDAAVAKGDYRDAYAAYGKAYRAAAA